jgi:hypothetical protein
VKEDTLQAGEFWMELDHFSFLKNNEYFQELVDGYTLFGSQWMPRAKWQAHPRLRLEAGAFFRRDFGANAKEQLQPMLTARVMLNRHQLLFGNLDGGLAHRLLEPLYDFENQIGRRMELGFQWKYADPRWVHDVWVDWRTMIYPQSPVQEEIVGGWNLEPLLLKKGHSRISLSLQGTVYHKGGQLDTVSVPLQTLYQAGLGIKGDWVVSEEGFIRELGCQVFGIGYKDGSPTPVAGLKKESFSPYVNLSLKTRFGTLMGSYWNSSEFRSYQGGGLFQTVSTRFNSAGRRFGDREMLLIRYLQDWKLGPDIWITVRAEPIFDLKNKKWEFSHGLYFNFRGKIWKTRLPSNI